MNRLSKTLTALAALALLITLPACDSEGTGTGTQVSFGDFTFSAVGNATVTEQGGRLVVSNIGTSGEDGIQAATPRAQTDVILETVSLSQGAEFVQRYLDAGGAEIATIRHDGLAGGEERVQIDFAGSVGATGVRAIYYNEGEVVYATDLTLGSSAAGARPSASAGTASSGSGSVHVVRTGGRTVVGTDFGGSLGGTRGVSAAAGRGVDFFIPQAEQSFVVDFIEFIPLAASGSYADLDVSTLKLTAGGISQFVLTDADGQAATTFTYDAFDPAIRGLFFSDQTGEYILITEDELISYAFDEFDGCYLMDSLSFVERLDADRYEAGAGTEGGIFTFTPGGEGVTATNPGGGTVFLFRTEQPSGGFTPLC